MKKVNYILLEVVTAALFIILFFVPWFGVETFFGEASISPAKIGPLLYDYIDEEAIPFYFLYIIPILAIISAIFHLNGSNDKGHKTFVASCVINLLVVVTIIIAVPLKLNEFFGFDVSSIVDLMEFTRLPFWLTFFISIIGFFYKKETADIVKEKINKVVDDSNIFDKGNPRLVCLEGAMTGAEMPFGGTEIVIGREAKSCNFVIRNASTYISRIHVIARYDSGKKQFYIKDTSSNGTFLLNGVRIPQNRDYPIAEGTHFYIGKREHVFVVRK